MTPPEKARAARLQKLFSLTPEDWQRIYDYQLGICPLCGRPFFKVPHVDHEHISGLVRGLLHPFCNKRLVDSIEYHQRAIAYLLAPPATIALGAPRYGRPGRVTNKVRKRRRRRVRVSTS